MELPADPEVEYLLKFMEASKRGIGFRHPNRAVKEDTSFIHLEANAVLEYAISRYITPS